VGIFSNHGERSPGLIKLVLGHEGLGAVEKQKVLHRGFQELCLEEVLFGFLGCPSG